MKRIVGRLADRALAVFVPQATAMAAQHGNATIVTARSMRTNVRCIKAGSCCSRENNAGATMRNGFENSVTGQRDRLTAST